MTTLVLDVGTNMEKFDMGDAFVGPWDIANLVSDFLMEKMGVETSACSTKAPTTSTLGSPSAEAAGSDKDKDKGSDEGLTVAVAAATVHGTFRLTAEMVQKVEADLASDFARYRFLVDFMQGLSLIHI